MYLYLKVRIYVFIKICINKYISKSYARSGPKRRSTRTQISTRAATIEQALPARKLFFIQQEKDAKLRETQNKKKYISKRNKT